MPLANVTFAAFKEKPKSVSTKHEVRHGTPVKWNLAHGVLYIADLDKNFKDGARAQNSSIALQN